MGSDSPLLDEVEDRLRVALALVQTRELGLHAWHLAVQQQLSELGAFLEEHGWTPSSKRHG
jgi:hypothetical protein